MKNSKLRRFYFTITSTFRFLLKIKNLKWINSNNSLSPFIGRIWSYYYSNINGEISEAYLCEPYYYNKLESKRNDFILAPFFEHKGYLDLILTSGAIHNIYSRFNGVIYNDLNEVVTYNDMCDSLDRVKSDIVIKRSVGTGGGKDVYIGAYTTLKHEARDLLSSSHDFVIQDCLEQHSTLTSYNTTSINTIRVLTFRVGGKINVISVVFRMGNGNRVDNSASGGLSCGVDLNSGKLNNFAVDHDFNVYTKHPFSHKKFSDRDTLPYFEEIKGVTSKNHSKIKNHDLISWDVSVDDLGRITIIEFNSVWSEINFHQVNNGPIFKEYMSYIKGL